MFPRYHANENGCEYGVLFKRNNQSIQNYGLTPYLKIWKAIQKGDGAAVIIFNRK
jgi:hypothetical protein